MKIDHSISNQVQSMEQNTASTSDTEKSSAEATSENQSSDTAENAASTNSFEKAVTQAKQELSVVRQFALLGEDNPTKEQVDAGVKIANDPATQKRLTQEADVTKQLGLLGVDNPTQEQVDAGVKIANDPEAQKRLQTELSIAHELAKLGVENLTKELVDAAVKVATDAGLQKEMQDRIDIDRQNQVRGLGEDSNLEQLLKSILDTPGDTAWSPFDAVTNALNTSGDTAWSHLNALNDALKTPGNTPWSLSGLANQVNPSAPSTPAPAGTPQSGGSSGTGGSSSTGGSNNTQTTPEDRSPGIDRADAGVSGNDGSANTAGDNGAVSDPSEWAPFPGSSTGGEPAAAEGTSTEKVHNYHSEDSGKTWEDRGVSWTEYPPTSVEVESPESGTDEGGGTKINEGEDDKYYAWGEGGSLDFGSLPAEGSADQIGNGSDSVTTANSETNDDIKSFYYNPESSTIRNRAYKDFMTAMDHAGGVTDGSRPDIEDSSTREAPYQAPGFGVIDTTPEVDDSTAFVGDPQSPRSGPSGDPTNPDNPVEAPSPGGPPSTDPYSDNS